MSYTKSQTTGEEEPPYTLLSFGVTHYVHIPKTFRFLPLVQKRQYSY